MVGLVSFLLTSCASVGPASQGESPSAELKKDTAKYERGAKELLAGIIQAWACNNPKDLVRLDPMRVIPLRSADEITNSINLKEEAVWVDTDSVTLRISWQKESEPRTGFFAVRHMANFIFKPLEPMTLSAIEGENPFTSNR